MNKSESILKIASALVKAQKSIGNATKGAGNPFFRSKYANLETVMDACKESLNANGISVLQPVDSTELGDFVETILMHESGEWLSSRMKLVLTKNDMQAYGSAVSYARRYGLQSMVFIAAQDDDGEATMGRATAPKVEAPKTEAKQSTIATAVASVPIGIMTNNSSPPVQNALTTTTTEKMSSFRKSNVKTEASPVTVNKVVATTGGFG